jgi:hypothetical protein
MIRALHGRTRPAVTPAPHIRLPGGQAILTGAAPQNDGLDGRAESMLGGKLITHREDSQELIDALGLSGRQPAEAPSFVTVSDGLISLPTFNIFQEDSEKSTLYRKTSRQ